MGIVNDGTCGDDPGRYFVVALSTYADLVILNPKSTRVYIYDAVECSKALQEIICSLQLVIHVLSLYLPPSLPLPNLTTPHPPTPPPLSLSTHSPGAYRSFHHNILSPRRCTSCQCVCHCIQSSSTRERGSGLC